MARDGYGCRDAGGARARCEAILAADAAMIPPRLGRQLDMNVLWYCDRGSVVVLACLRGARLRCAHSSAAAPAALVVRLIHCNAVVDVKLALAHGIRGTCWFARMSTQHTTMKLITES